MKNHLTYYLLIALTSTLTLLFVSLQSYTHDLCVIYDSTWYFMCGKAWMNGLLPYVDFADSKGPLLWLIFGLAYELSHCTFLGVYWLTCLFYTLTGCLLYRTALLFVRTRREAFMGVMLTMAVLLGKLLRNDVHAEDFSLPFFAWALHTTCQRLYGQQRRGARPWATGLILGLCIGGGLLIKFTSAAMMLVFVCFAAHHAGRRGWGKVLGGAMLGTIAMVLPFCAYFLGKGIMGDFVHEYFIQTFVTTAHAAPRRNSLWLLTSANNYGLLAIVLPGLLAMPALLHHYRFFPLVAFLWIYVLSLPNAWPNYVLPASLFALFSALVVLTVVRYERWPRLSGGLLTLLLMVFTIGTTLWMHNYRRAEQSDFFAHDSQLRRQFYSYEYVIAQKHHPRMVYLAGVQPVHGICSEALPACKYFAHQFGATEEMVENQAEALRTGRADFALARHGNERCNRLLREAGYHPYYIANPVADYVLYAKEPIVPPPASFHVSNADVLLKRPIHFGR